MTKNWGYRQFQHLVKFVSDCGEDEVKTHLISSPKNIIHKLPQYIGKLLDVIDDYIKVPLLASIRKNYFTFSNDKTHDIIIVGISLSVSNIIKFLEKYFQEQSVDLTRA